MMNVKKHILMVDDVATNLKCAAEIFKDDFRLSMEKSGENALLFLKHIKPDLVILDINMPNMDGYEFLEQMKSDPEYAHIPVVFLTSDSDMESEIKSLRMGAMDYIRKPFDPQVMISRIHKILEIEDIKKELSLKSCTDSLTGLWDRKYFEEQVNDSLEQNNQGVFFLIDLDNFKYINDTYGHIAGDKVLKSFCEKVLVLSEDHMFAGRLGGDEFAVFIRGKMEINQIKETALLLIQNLNHAIMNCIGYLEGVGVSVGISVADRDGKDFLTLYHKADKALYYVKQNGKHGYHFFMENDADTFSSPSVQKGDIGFRQLKNMIEEPVDCVGAYQVETDNFRSIFQFITRSISRTKQHVHMLLFTLEHKDNINNFDRAEALVVKTLEKVIGNSLRRGDVQARFSNLQIVVILMDATKENSSMVAKRILQQFLNENIENYSLLYEIEEIQSNKVNEI